MNPKNLKSILSSEYCILIVISIAALFIRLLSIDKAGGLWRDEMLTYVFSLSNSAFGVIKTILRNDFHMPLYYLYVNVWMKFFGSNDLVLRLSSVLLGVLSVPASFYLGKTYKSKSLGYFLSLIVALSPIMIYYSQEFRFYSMLMFFSMLSLIFFLKLLDATSKKDFILFSLSNLVILYIYTMGIIFVFTELVVLSFHFYKYRKAEFKVLIKYMSFLFIAAIPYLIMLVLNLRAADQALLEPLGWSKLNNYSLLFFVQDWFSPNLMGLNSQNPDYYAKFFASSLMYSRLFFISLSTICFFTGFVLALNKINRKMLYLLIIFGLFFATELILSAKGSLATITRYTLICLPIIFLISCDGLISIKNRVVKVSLISIILFIFINNVVHYKTAISFSNRGGGLSYPAEFLLKQNLGKNDYIIYPTCTDMIKKYIPNAKFIDFSFLGIINLDKTKQEQSKIFDKEFILTTNKYNYKDKLYPYLLNTEPTPELKHFMNSSIAKIPKGNRLFLVQGELIPRINSPEINQRFVKRGSSKNLRTIIFGKMFSDIRKTIEANPSIEKLEVKTNPRIRSYTLYIYRKK